MFAFVVVAGGLAAQGPMHLQPYAVTSLARYDTEPDHAGSAHSGKRLAALFQDWVGPRENGAIVRADRKDVLIARLPAEQNQLVADALAQLDLAEPRHARLQFTVLTLPAKLAAKHGVAEDAVAVLAPEAVIALTRAATKGGGTLHNLLECGLAPLRPSVVEGAGRKAQWVWVVRCEMVPVKNDQALLTVELGRRSATPMRGEVPMVVLGKSMVAATGSSIVVTTVERELATVLVVRLVELAQKPLAPAK